jgi:hypothetical protein
MPSMVVCSEVVHASFPDRMGFDDIIAERRDVVEVSRVTITGEDGVVVYLLPLAELSQCRCEVMMWQKEIRNRTHILFTKCLPL